MTGRIEKTVFISYRRTNLPWALNIYQDLTHHGYDVFFDYQSIDSGDFDKIILDNIKARAHFLVVLTTSALDRCKEPNDWLRREIETALDEKRNIVPLMMEGFDFGSPSVDQALTGKLAALRNKNGLPIYAAYFFEGMEKLRNRYLNTALSDLPIQPLSAEAQEATEVQQAAADEAPPVEQEQLTAQKWFERGYMFATEAKNFDEAIRCFSEAILIQPEFSQAYYNRGHAYQDKGKVDDAIADYSEAIRFNPDYAEPYNNRGIICAAKGDLDAALKDYKKAISLNPGYAVAYNNRGILYENKGHVSAALKDYKKAISLNPDYASAYHNRAIALKINGEYPAAIVDLQKYLEIGGGKRFGDQRAVERQLKELRSKLTKKKSIKKKSK